jgi:hypothetical protein
VSFLGQTPPIGDCPGRDVKFVAARQLAEHPIAVSLWEREQDDGSEADGSSVVDD